MRNEDLGHPSNFQPALIEAGAHNVTRGSYQPPRLRGAGIGWQRYFDPAVGKITWVSQMPVQMPTLVCGPLALPLDVRIQSSRGMQTTQTIITNTLWHDYFAPTPLHLYQKR